MDRELRCLSPLTRIATDAATPILTLLAIAVTQLGHASAQEAPGETEIAVYTVADSLLGGAGGLSVDRMGMVYAGTFDDRVYRIRIDGQAEVFSSGFYGATGNVVGPMGELYQLNFHGGYITAIDRRGNQTVLATGLETPMDVTRAAGDLFVANCGTNSIARVTLDGEVTTLVNGPPFNCPNGITYASDGSLYAVNFSDAKLLRVTLDGRVTEVLTLPHSQNIIDSSRGHLYIASGSGRQLHRISLTTGEIVHLAGTGERGSRDGRALEATFTWPNGIAATEDGRVFIHDLIGGASLGNGSRQLSTGSLRLISLPSLTEILIDIYDSAGADAMIAAYHEYRADEAMAGMLDEVEVDGWGDATLPVLPAAAITIFRLNVESYPGSWRAHEALGDAYEAIGQPAEALAAFEQALEIDPENEAIAAKVRRLR